MIDLKYNKISTILIFAVDRVPQCLLEMRFSCFGSRQYLFANHKTVLSKDANFAPIAPHIAWDVLLQLTKPQSTASLAVMICPPKTTDLARVIPMICGKRTQPPAAGIKPKGTELRKVASEELTKITGQCHFKTSSNRRSMNTAIVTHGNLSNRAKTLSLLGASS